MRWPKSPSSTAHFGLRAPRSGLGSSPLTAFPQKSFAALGTNGSATASQLMTPRYGGSRPVSWRLHHAPNSGGCCGLCPGRRFVAGANDGTRPVGGAAVVRQGPRSVRRRALRRGSGPARERLPKRMRQIRTFCYCLAKRSIDLARLMKPSSPGSDCCESARNTSTPVAWWSS
jgi:hypothetical protein